MNKRSKLRGVGSDISVVAGLLSIAAGAYRMGLDETLVAAGCLALAFAFILDSGRGRQ